jgi:hypothetical protein
VSTDLVQASDLAWFKVVLTHPGHNDKVVFRSVSENRARRFMESRFPRGSEAFLQLPDGSIEHYERERQGDMGADVPVWMPFDRSSWVPAADQAPPGENAWSDKEG